MTLIDSIVSAGRQHLRDFPLFFQMTPQVAGRTYKLEHGNVIPASLYVATRAGTTGAATEIPFTIDERNGILRLTAQPNASAQLMIEGYYYEWVSDPDFAFHAKVAVNTLTTPSQPPLESLSPVVLDAAGIVTVVNVLWALAAEYSRDIDVSTPEAVHVPASQRYRMTLELLRSWQARAAEIESALNIGLNRLEQYQIRRISMTWNRLVPVYVPKEIGDNSPIERLWPAIPTGLAPGTEAPEDLREDVYVEEVPAQVGTTWPAQQVWNV